MDYAAKNNSHFPENCYGSINSVLTVGNDLSKYTPLSSLLAAPPWARDTPLTSEATPMFKFINMLWAALFNIASAAESLSRIAAEESERLRISFEIEGIASNNALAASLAAPAVPATKK